MAIRHEYPGRRSIQMEREVPGTPEQAWKALATGSGVFSWFYPTEERESACALPRCRSHTRMSKETMTRFEDDEACLGHHRRPGALGRLVSSSACLCDDGRRD